MKATGLLWKFYKGDPNDCHYLFGTMHLATDAAYTYAELAKEYIQKSSLYAAEMDLNDANNKDMMVYFRLSPDAQFSDFFRPKQYIKYRSVILKALNIDLDHYLNFTPFFINNLLAEVSLKRTKNEALDHHLWQFSLNQQLEMVGVESFEDQLNILKKIPLDYQIKSFKDTVRNISSFRKKINNLNELYRKGDLVQLYKSSRKSMGSIRKMMIYDRNILMTHRIIELSNLKPSFFAVGAAHFAGNKGIIALLKKNGYILKSI